VRDAHATLDARARHETHATPRITGTLHVTASARGERTVIDVLRQDGLARCSRPLHDPSQPGAVRLVVAQLGPGFVRGDRFETCGEVGSRADLIVAAQSATRILGRGAPSVARATWRVGEDARLFIRGEPAIAHDGASHIAETRVDLAHGASLTWLDALAPHGAFGTIATSLRVFADATLAIYDRSTYHSGTLRAAVVTGFYVRAGLSAEDTANLVALADAHACETREGISIGVGSPACGGVMLRATGPSVRDALDTVAMILSIVRRRDSG
jgi:urease accessory protein UreH